MPRSKRDNRGGPAARNGHGGANGAAGRGGGASSRTRRGSDTAGKGGGSRQDLRTAQEQAIREVREGYDRLGRELTSATGRLAESIRHAQEQLADIVRQAREARRDVEELRELARDAHRERMGEPATGDRAGAADGGHGVPRGRRPGRTARPETRNHFGVTVGSGVVVAELLPDNPAAKAGLKRGDVIEVVNGTEIVSATQLRDVVRAAGDDADVRLRVLRAGQAKEVRVRLGKAGDEPGDEGRNRLGVTVGPGVVVAEVLPNTPAARAGLERGDVIDDVSGTAVLNGEQFRQVVQQLPAGSDAILRVTRAGKVREVRARFDSVSK
jgi:PDZ domain